MPGSGENVIFENLGNGSFSSNPSWVSADHRDTIHLQFIDFDRDGRLELLSGNQGSRICFYESDPRGLSTDTRELFRYYWQEGFCVGRFPQFATSSAAVHLLCSWKWVQEQGYSISKAYIYEFLPGIMPPINPDQPSWPEATDDKPLFANEYHIRQLDGLDHPDWVGCNGASICYGLSTQTGMTTGSLAFVPPCPDDDIFNATAGIDAADLDGDGDCELVIAQRGVRRSDGMTHYMTSTRAIVTEVDWEGVGSFAEVAWMSTDACPKTALAIGDIDGDGVASSPISLEIDVACQTFFLDGPVNGIMNVRVNGTPLDQDEYHLDRDVAFISLVNPTHSSGILTADVLRTGKPDLIFACDGQDRSFLQN